MVYHLPTGAYEGESLGGATLPKAEDPLHGSFVFLAVTLDGGLPEFRLPVQVSGIQNFVNRLRRRV